ncbi:unnamed protein product [Closterium sp. NIES-53]
MNKRLSDPTIHVPPCFPMYPCPNPNFFVPFPPSSLFPRPFPLNPNRRCRSSLDCARLTRGSANRRIMCLHVFAHTPNPHTHSLTFQYSPPLSRPALSSPLLPHPPFPSSFALSLPLTHNRRCWSSWAAQDE